jgi:hypothetical protein
MVLRQATEMPSAASGDFSWFNAISGIEGIGYELLLVDGAVERKIRLYICLPRSQFHGAMKIIQFQSFTVLFSVRLRGSGK